MARPGKVTIHQVPDGRKFLPMARSTPQSGIPAGSPRPMKDREDSVTMASAMFRENTMTTVAITLGKM